MNVQQRCDHYLSLPVAIKLSEQFRNSQQFYDLHTKALDIINCGHDVDGFDLDSALIKLHEDECAELPIVSNDILELLLHDPGFAQTVVQRALLDICIYELHSMDLWGE